MCAAEVKPRPRFHWPTRLFLVRSSRGLAVLAALLLNACVSHNYAPVRDLTRPTPVMSGSHQVIRGETLYSIAWRYGRDYRDLARINSIRSPYVIKPGQRLYLQAQRSAKPAVAVKATKASSNTRQQAPAKTPQRSVAQVAAGSPEWRWPLNGKLTGQFARSGGRGIDIEASRATVVRAAADGVVVYAGDGLIGYGNLVIIKHNETYLSAYAHNRKLLVSEQKTVKVGQKIAEIGSTGKKNQALHFEIRKNGKPVNPLSYLPKG